METKSTPDLRENSHHEAYIYMIVRECVTLQQERKTIEKESAVNIKSMQCVRILQYC
jgi:hypothetical protein